MKKIQAITEFISGQSMQLSLQYFIINLLFTAILSWLLAYLYIYFGTTLSNRRKFASTFSMISLTTMIIITVIKSSLALSLGLVGALSIVRFRAAIKEPEELAFIFVAISLGLGFGADQRLITLVGFAFIAFSIIIRRQQNRHRINQNTHLIISTNPKIKFERINSIVIEHAQEVELKRLDQSTKALEISYLVDLDELKHLGELKNDLLKLDKNMTLTFLDYQVVL